MMAGKIARKAKNATPPASIGTWSAVASFIARRVICHHPRAGIWVGSSASSPGRFVEVAAGPFGSFAPVWPFVPVGAFALVEAGGTPGSTVATCPLVGPPGRGGRGRNGSTRACRSVD